MSENLVTIESFITEVEATVAKERLESFNIPAYLRKDDCGGMYPHMQLTRGIILKVHECDVQNALEILQAGEDNEENGETDTREEMIEDITIRILMLLRKAKGWVLIGFALLPGWISYPLEFKYSTDALKLYRDYSIEDVPLKSKIHRTRLFTGVLTVIYWGVIILHLLNWIRAK